MTIIRKGDYRIQTITKFAPSGKFEEMPIADGLAIEKKVPSNDDYYYVIGFVYYNDNDLCCRYEDVSMRTLDIVGGKEWDLVSKLLRVAEQLIIIANMEVEE